MVGTEFLYLYRHRGSTVNLGRSADHLALLAGVAGLLATRALDLFPLVLAPLLLFYYTLRYVRPSSFTGNYLDSPLLTAAMLLSALTSSFLSATAVNFYGVANVSSELALGFVKWNFVGAIWDTLSFLVTVTGSPWFMVAMGVWLGALVLDKVRETKKRGNKIRLVLMFVSYWVYSIYLPSFSPIASQFPAIPYSWFNGLGTFGPVEPSLLIGLLGTYAVTAVLSFMLGSRQICSVTCTAPYMLQGTFMDSLKKYNRTSRLGRKTLTSRISRAFKVSSTLTWTTLLTFAVLSLLNSLRVIHFSILGNDPTMVATAFYFNFLWYLQFLASPYLGDYACVTHGICGWGTFNQFFGYLGPFRVKAKDPAICLKCRTVDCAKACPVGLTDMRSSFVKRGEFKALKCIGAGECIDDCPHDNIFILDVRNKLKKLKVKI
ncbi:hypothetical protein GCM10007116_22500 [Sulfodiicoccus acidiphilus]|uniref:4Fe-4S ferredoxin-type domain-containing protein n=1 Tax=Sulfodiicoccus acidiphilus TaxID=1670455 RepID=A0A830H6S1_9CREN|nr:hypothetical protein GCM10007116_22500 [Sulfodiicoccus acidiphilus]